MSSLISATNEAPLALIMLLIIITSQEQLPLAPYSLKLYCRMGAMDSKEANVTKLCPTASTACGYLEFSDPNVSRRTISSGNENSVGIYECVDSSIFMTENEDNENAKQDMFARFCDHRARCRIMSAGWLNGQFLQYLTKVRRVDGTRARSSAIVKFCCAINDALLDEVIRSGLNVLPTVSNKKTLCNNQKCAPGAIGCLVYSKEPYMDEVIRVRPAQLKFDDDYEDVTREDGSDKDPQAYNERSSYYYYDERSEYIAEYHCVQRHFNDELYRYCVLVHSNKSPSHCFEGHGYRICCCFFTSDSQSCDPLERSQLPTSLITPPHRPLLSTPAFFRTEITTKLLTDDKNNSENNDDQIPTITTTMSSLEDKQRQPHQISGSHKNGTVNTSATIPTISKLLSPSQPGQSEIYEMFRSSLVNGDRNETDGNDSRMRSESFESALSSVILSLDRLVNDRAELMGERDHFEDTVRLHLNDDFASNNSIEHYDNSSTSLAISFNSSAQPTTFDYAHTRTRTRCRTVKIQRPAFPMGIESASSSQRFAKKIICESSEQIMNSAVAVTSSTVNNFVDQLYRIAKFILLTNANLFLNSLLL